MADRSYLGQPGLSRGLMNNNAGNLIITPADSTNPWVGEIPVAQNTDGEFAQFYTLYPGLRAMAENMINLIKDNNYTLSQYLTVYAPPSQNNTAGYITRVSGETGLDPNEPLAANLDAILVASLMKAQIEVENGPDSAALITDDDIAQSINLLPPLILAEIGNLVKSPAGIGIGLTIAAVVAGIIIFK